jgi:hypothetical protein
MQVLNFAISLAMISLLLGAIYKVLHDEPIVWRDIAVSPFLYRLADRRSPVRLVVVPLPPASRSRLHQSYPPTVWKSQTMN